MTIFRHKICHKYFKFSIYRDIKKKKKKTQNYRHKNIATFLFCQFFQVKKSFSSFQACARWHNFADSMRLI